VAFSTSLRGLCYRFAGSQILSWTAVSPPGETTSAVILSRVSPSIIAIQLSMVARASRPVQAVLSPEPKKAQHREDNNDEANDVNDAMHVRLL
jgi:hypothetical protein